MRNNTIVINLFGGPGCGKSTTAALLFGQMKLLGLHVELVREYVKHWAWSDRKVKQSDQLYLLGKQSSYESTLYGKVDYIVTDSPILLAGVYQEYRSKGKDKYVGEAAKAFLREAEKENVTHLNFFLKRVGPFDTRGRWESEKEAKEIDNLVQGYLKEFGNGLNFEIDGPPESRASEILGCVLGTCQIG